ncbi:MAG: glycosyltransferase [Myxococcota bacterium]
MHIALVTPYFPDASAGGGRTRIARLSAALAQQGQVHLFAALAEEDLATEQQRGGGAVDPYARVVTHLLESSPPRGFGPVRVRRFPERLARAIAAAHDASPFDVVVLVHSYAGPGIAYLQDATVVLDEPDVRSNVELRNVRADASRVVPRLYALQQWKNYERTVWDRADAITLGRPRDLSAVHVHRSDTGLVVPNGVDAESFFYTPPSRRKGNTVLFVGDMRAPAIVAGAKELVQQVLPRLRMRIPDVALTLAGRSPPRDVRALESDDVRVAGGLTSVMPLYRDHAVFAVPIAAGGEGVSSVLEPMACGMPVVAPPPVLHELPAEEDRDYLAARSVPDLADRLAAALANRKRLDEMALSARRIAERQDWEIIGERFARIVMATVARKQRDRGESFPPRGRRRSIFRSR